MQKEVTLQEFADNEQISHKYNREENLILLSRQIKFDGFKFWLNDINIGEISEEFMLTSPISKEIMQHERNRVICEIFNICDNNDAGEI